MEMVIERGKKHKKGTERNKTSNLKTNSKTNQQDFHFKRNITKGIIMRR